MGPWSMRRHPARVLLLIALAATAPAAVAARRWYRSPVLHIESVSNFDVRQAFAADGFGTAGSAGLFRPLSWSSEIRSEADALAAARSIDSSAAGLAAGPHVSAVQAQGTIRLRLPVLDDIAAYSNTLADIWILRQKKLTGELTWRTYAIVQVKTVSPNVAYFFDIEPGAHLFRGQTCYTCHASGPRVIRPLRPDLIWGGDVAAGFNERIAANGFVEMHFPSNEAAWPRGPALPVEPCVECHTPGGERGPLYRVHSESIRTFVANGAMPRDGQIAAAQMAELEKWLAGK